MDGYRCNNINIAGWLAVLFLCKKEKTQEKVNTAKTKK